MWRERGRGKLGAGRLGKRSICPLSQSALSPVAGREWGVDGVRAHCGASLFARERSLSHYQQSGAKTGPVRSSHREVAKAPFFHGFVVLDFQIILIFRNCGLFCVQMYFSELRVDTWNH